MAKEVIMFFKNKAQEAMAVVESATDAERRHLNTAARVGARAYIEQLDQAVKLLSEFGAKRVQNKEDMTDMKRALSNAGIGICMVTSAQGMSAIIDHKGNVLATYMREGQEEAEQP
jgi:hypothetical protein